jgi:NADPH2:quinone reductase
MKAAVLHQFGENPRYEDFPDPMPGPEQELIQVAAIALENVDKAVAAGTHYASRQFLSTLPAIVGFDGIGRLTDGALVGFGGTSAPYGAMAEKTVVPKGAYVPVPEGVSAVVAAALPAAALTSLFPLRNAARLQPGETVLINGATGVAGQLAVQIARLLGAGRIVGSGRNPVSLEKVRADGADAVIDLTQPAETLAAAYKRAAGESGYDVVLDFLWGPPTEALLRALTPDKLQFSKRVRVVQIGNRAGDAIALPAEALRTSGVEIYGAAAGLAADTMAGPTEQMWAWLKAGQLHMEIEEVPLSDIEQAWQRSDFQGRRLVVVI